MDAQIGHNRPPFDIGDALETATIKEFLEDKFAAKIERAKVLRDGIVRFNKATEFGIVDEETQQKATAFVSQLKKECAAVEDFRKKTKDPVLEAGKTIDAFFKGRMLDGLKDGVKQIEAKMTVFADALDEKRRAEALEKARLEMIAADEAAQRALHERDDVAFDQAVQAEEVAEAKIAAVESAKPADFSRTHGDLGGVSSLRVNWKWRLVNIQLVPPQFFCLDLGAINDHCAEIRKSGIDKVGGIPGIEFYQEKAILVR